MGKRSNKPTKKRPRRGQSKILEAISATDASTILRRLAEQDAETAKRIEEIATEILSDVDAESVASDVQMALESLDVEEVWDRSGSTRHGYVDPGDAACEMFEEALAPFQDQLEQYKQLSVRKEAKRVRMGILKGIYDFEKESDSEYKDWAMDTPREYFATVLDDWKKSTKKRNELAEIDEFTEKNCADWAGPRRKKRR